MTTTATSAKRPRVRKAPSRRVEFAVLARAVEMASDGSAPVAARLWKAGWNTTDKGDLNFTPRSAQLVMQAWRARGNPLAWYYEHEDRLPLNERGGAPMKGVCSAPSSMLAIRDGEGGPECWAEQIAWTDEAKRQITAGERRQLSPVAAFDADTREIIEIVNVSLCAEGATHHGTLLASRARAHGKGRNVDEIIDQITEALESGDFETAENLVQQAEAMAGEDEGMARMARMAKVMVKGAKAKAPPPPPPAPKPADGDVATKRLAAARYEEDFARATAAANAQLTAATEEAKRAARDSRRATVVVLIEANRGLFDVVDEREHIAAADPAATKRHIDSLKRKGGAEVIAASRATIEASKGNGGGSAKPPKDDPEKKDDEPTDAERTAIEAFNRGKKDEQKITLADFRASKARQQMTPARGN